MRNIDKDLELTRLATPGPWKWEVSRLWDGYSGLDGKDDAEVLYPDHCNDGDGGAAWFGEFPSEADAAFIAASREALPYWLEEVKRLREAIGGKEVADWAVEAVGCRREAARASLEAINLRAENQRLKEALNAINNLAVGWQEGDIPITTGDIIDEIYKLSLLPEEGK